MTSQDNSLFREIVRHEKSTDPLYQMLCKIAEQEKPKYLDLLDSLTEEQRIFLESYMFTQRQISLCGERIAWQVGLEYCKHKKV